MQTMSPQTASIYKLLSNGRILSAQEIADELEILPNVIYRAAKKLVDLGIVEQIETYPVRFKALPTQIAMSLYLVSAIQSFRREFGSVAQTASVDNTPAISLLKNRANLLRAVTRDIRAARYGIDYLVSGHEVPDETILAFRKATTNGVRVRKIVHQKDQLYSQQNKELQKIGVAIRFLPGLDVRLFIFDKKITYLTSYTSKNPGSGFGVRFDYSPLALQMSQLFEQNWERAARLN